MTANLSPEQKADEGAGRVPTAPGSIASGDQAASHLVPSGNDPIAHGEVHLVELSITSFRGSIGGEHYYGQLSVNRKAELIRKPDGGQSCLYRSGHGVERHPHDGHSIERRIGAKEAVYLNKKDNEGFVTPSFRLKSGDLVNRFNDKSSVIAAAIEEFPKLFGQRDLLVLQERIGTGVYKPLAGPAEAVEFLASTDDYVRQQEYLADGGYLYSNHKRDTDEHPKGEDPEGLSGEAMPAGARQGIAQPQQHPESTHD